MRADLSLGSWHNLCGASNIRETECVTQAVAAAGSLKEVQAAHDVFLSDASGVAFTSSQQTTKLLKAALCRLLSLVWEFALAAPSDEAQVRHD